MFLGFGIFWGDQRVQHFECPLFVEGLPLGRERCQAVLVAKCLVRACCWSVTDVTVCITDDKGVWLRSMLLDSQADLREWLSWKSDCHERTDANCLDFNNNVSFLVPGVLSFQYMKIGPETDEPLHLPDRLEVFVEPLAIVLI